jgi:U3 small nucleolar RNA-associated protein 25
MALFPSNRAKIRGGNRGARGSNRGVPRSRGRGYGRGDRRAGLKKKVVFYSTRVEEEPNDASRDNEESPDRGDEDVVLEASELSSDSDENVQIDGAQPYSTLLQSLSANSERYEGGGKKRKLEQTQTSNKEKDSATEGDLDRVAELEEVEAFGSNDSEVDEHEEDYDPFLSHVANPENGVLEQKLLAVKRNAWSTERSSQKLQWSYILKVPAVSDLQLEPSLGIGQGTVSGAESLMLKQKFRGHAKEELASLDGLMGSLAYSIFHYRDVLFTHRTLDNCANIRKLACLHALNHVFKTRDKVIKDNARLAKEDAGEDIELRDQGFTRPKVLILLPTRHSCVRYADTIISFCEPEQQENKKRFQDSYAAGQSVSDDKPEDFRELFDGNDDDMFRLGLKFTRKTVKFFAQFYNSDIIFASPLGLRMALGADDPKKQDHDFLSSIEVVIMDQTEAMLMQNWEHIEYIFERMNLQPKEAHGCDFSRVRNWYLDGNAKYLRQTILLSAFNFPSLNKLYTHHMLNAAGKMKYLKEEGGAMLDLGLSLRQTFSRFDYGTPVDEPDNRFKYFTTSMLPSLTKTGRQGASGGQGVLIYLPSYADFVRVRNYLAASSTTQNISFGSISEYTSAQDVARARSHFSSGRHSVLLYTERAHHFRRYHLKGVKRVLMYALPENPIFYKEIVGGFLGTSISAAKLDVRDAGMRALFSKLDVLKLERIVGTGRYTTMLKEKGGDTFDFV